MERPLSVSDPSSPNQNVSSFMVLQGYLVTIGKVSRINSPRSGIYGVRWLKNRLPAKVKQGSYVTIVGQLITLELGRGFLIIKAQALKPKSIRRIKKLIKEELL